MSPSTMLLAVLSALLAPAAAAKNHVLVPATGCTITSLTLPSWLIQDFQYSKAGGASFRAVNRATNASAELACQVSASDVEWRACSAKATAGATLGASFKLNGTNVELRVNETWSCNDVAPSKPIQFSAVGNNSLSLSCDATACKSAPAPLLVKGSLLSPVQITPAYVAGPTGHDSDGCSARAKTPAWHVGKTQYNSRIVSSKAGAVVTRSQSLFIEISKNDTDYIAVCSGFFPSSTGLQPLSCSEEGPYRPRDKYHVQTDAFFDPSNYLLTVNETWFCDDASPAAPVSFSASGSTKLEWECFNDQSENLSGQIEDVAYCTTGGQPLSGSVVAQQSLPPYALNDPVSTTDSCTVSSFVAPTWRISDFEVTSVAGTTGTISMSLELQTNDILSDYPTTVVQSGIDLSAAGGSAWYPCIIAPGDQATPPSSCSFRYNATSQLLSLNTEWICNDLDAAHPITFNGQATTTVPDLDCTTQGRTERCATGERKPWSASVNSTSWKSSVEKAVARLF